MATPTPHPCSSRFFRILWPSFIQKLIIPKAFVKHILKGVSIKRARLVNPNGNSWLINIYKENQCMYFGGDGWKELIHAHNLKLGYILVFSYKGNMVLNFRAYDLSTCEITYPSKVFNAKIRNPKVPKNFEVIMTSHNLSRQCLYIPVEFTRQCDGLAHRHELILKDSKGQSWPVHLCHRKMAKHGSGMHIGGGWLQFAKGNSLDIGDKCIFKLKQRKQGDNRRRASAED
ncbi:B3 domain-containing protein REM9-like [Asparagus officinalis]|uniref:B3 domain-containing protein REM9-like n=1 Tax=Asparagus officinalis TaxID=4686 RepID=UPI00098E2E90|nr:B3 domain-containing protein REM9-like [Asparagus officinalis]